jgi:hypothetical protein
MPENPYHQEKEIRRISERIEDKTKLVEEAFFNSMPVKLLSDNNESMIAPLHSHQILKEAATALQHNDMEEAAHQLRREVNFCNMVPKMKNSPYEKSGQAGLQALNKHKSAVEIDREMVMAWEKAWDENPAPFYKKD